MYLPLETPSNTSKSASEMHYRDNSVHEHQRLLRKDTDPAREIGLHCEYSYVLGTRNLDNIRRRRHRDGHCENVGERAIERKTSRLFK